MKRNTLIPTILMFLALFLSVGCTGTYPKNDAGRAQISVTPNRGVPGTKLLITGTGFIPKEKVKVILHVQNVQLQFGTSGSGGVCVVNQDGTFKLEPIGGVPIAASIVKPGSYKVDAIGEKGSFASSQLEVLKKE